MSTRQVLVVEDDPRLCAAIASLLAPRPLELVFAGSIAEALAWTAETPDLVVVDLGLPDGDGTELIAFLAKKKPGLPLLVLSGAGPRAKVLSALEAGACGYILKEDLGERLGSAIDDALAGGMPMSPGAARHVLASLRKEPDVEAGPALTERERDVLEALARGLTYAEAGVALGVSINTVRRHVNALYEKLHAGNKAEAVMIAVREGWLSR